MQHVGRWIGSKTTGVLALSFVSLLFLSLFSPGDPPRANSEQDMLCLECHEEMDQSLLLTSHRPSFVGGAEGMHCASCHTGAEAHLEDPDVGTIANPAKQTGVEAREICGACHDAHRQLDNYGFDPHTQMQLNCSSCHSVHGGEADALLSDRPEFCEPCHQNVVSSFRRRSQHPVNQRNVTCLDCHSFVKRIDQEVLYDLSRVCRDCHPDVSGPFLYEHDATNAYSVEGGSCLECHMPHSSESDRLLRQPGAGVCLQCHVKPPGHDNMPALHGPVRFIEECWACHSGVHGSFTSSRYLDPMLQDRLGSPQDCASCHDLMN